MATPLPRLYSKVTKTCVSNMHTYDSQFVIGRVQNNMHNGKSRHIRCRHNTIRQLLSTGVISLDYVKSKENIAIR